MVRRKPDWTARRQRMVEKDIAARGIDDQRVLDAMATVPREAFVSERVKDRAYEDTPLPIEEGQTISQPFIVAQMAQAAELDQSSRVLEVGAGSGYGAAILGRVAHEVWTIERHELLAAKAAHTIAELGYHNVHVICGDGTLGYPPAAPYDAIVVTAGAPVVPKTLIEQLVVGGRLIIPVGPQYLGQQLLRIRRTDDGVVEENLGAVRFVPLISDGGSTPSAG